MRVSQHKIPLARKAAVAANFKYHSGIFMHEYYTELDG
jgi:hypothetical protein